MLFSHPLSGAYHIFYSDLLQPFLPYMQKGNKQIGEMAKEILLVLAAVSCLLVGSTAQPAHVVHIVGGSKGWYTPPNTTFYDEWAAKKNFTVGDKLSE